MINWELFHVFIIQLDERKGEAKFRHPYPIILVVMVQNRSQRPQKRVQTIRAIYDLSLFFLTQMMKPIERKGEAY